MHNNCTQPTAVIFLRVRHFGADGPDRKQEHQLIAHQRAACRRTAEALDAQIIREYVEYGGTGRLDKRPTLRLMLDELRALRDVNYIIATGHDRLTRNSRDMAALSFEIDAGGAALVIDGSISTQQQKEIRI